MNIQPPRIGPQPWEIVRTKLDQSLPFANMRDTPYYRDCIWEQFSKKEYERRYAALRAKMREAKLDAIIAPGGPSHWSFGGAMLWLTGHWEWHALAAYVLVPLEGEPTLIYSMGGTHAEAVRRQVDVVVKDVRHSRNGRYADIMVERLRELKLERGRIGLMEIDPRHNDYMPVNQYNVLRHNLPDAELVFTSGFLHELLSVHSEEELDCVRVAGKLCEDAMNAMVARARPGVKEYELRAAAGAAILEGGGDIDFLIIGSTPMDNPALIFGNPRPSARELKKGDIINMELAAGYRGYTAQIGSPDLRRRAERHGAQFLGEDHAARLSRRSSPRSRPASRSRTCGRRASSSATTACSRARPKCTASISSPTSRTWSPSTSPPKPFEQVLKPGMIIMAEPNPISADGLFGIFLGHTFIVTDKGHEVVDKFPLEIAVSKW